MSWYLKLQCEAFCEVSNDLSKREVTNAQRTLLMWASVCSLCLIALLVIVAYANGQVPYPPDAPPVGTWSLVDSPSNCRLYAVDGVLSTDVWAVGGTGYKGTILHWNGSTWLTVTESLTRSLYSISMAAPAVGHAVGGDQRYPPFECLFLRWDGSTWVDESEEVGCIPPWDSAYSIYMLSPTDYWASKCWHDRVRECDIIHIHNGIEEDTFRIYYGYVGSLTALSATDVWATGGQFNPGDDLGGSEIYRWDGDAWSDVPHPADYVTSISMVSATDGWAVGGEGTIMHWDGDTWTMQPSPTTSTLWAVDLSTSNSGWAVGDDGVILHFDGSDWIAVTSPTTNTLRDVTMLSSLEGWAVGDNGTILHYANVVDHLFLPNLLDQSDAALLMHLNEPPGATTFKNESEYGNDGTCVGATCPTAGVSGFVNTAVHFDGVDDHINLGNPANMNQEGEITLEAWVKVEATDGIRNIVAHGYTDVPQAQAEVFLRVQNGYYEVGSWNGQSHKTVYAIPAEDLGQWVHLVGLYDGIAWRLFRNGLEVSSAYGPTGAVSVNEDWALGAHGDGTERFFQGALDEVSVYFRALSAQEIASRYSEAGNRR